jgi:multisubunit Na+/H+ antiporter MnhG subunit
MTPGTATLSPTTENIRREQLAGLGFWSALAAFVTWSAMGIESVMRPFQDNRREAFWPVPFVCTMVAFTCVHLLQRSRSRAEKWGWILVVIASALMLLGNIGLQLNIPVLERLNAPLGPVIWMTGLVCFGIGTLAARALPAMAGWAIILLEPASILIAFALSPVAPLLPRGAYSGNIGKGLSLALVAWALRRFCSE